MKFIDIQFQLDTPNCALVLLLERNSSLSMVISTLEHVIGQFKRFPNHGIRASLLNVHTKRQHVLFWTLGDSACYHFLNGFAMPEMNPELWVSSRETGIYESRHGDWKLYFIFIPTTLSNTSSQTLVYSLFSKHQIDFKKYFRLVIGFSTV